MSLAQWWRHQRRWRHWPERTNEGRAFTSGLICILILICFNWYFWWFERWIDCVVNCYWDPIRVNCVLAMINLSWVTLFDGASSLSAFRLWLDRLNWIELNWIELNWIELGRRDVNIEIRRRSIDVGRWLADRQTVSVQFSLLLTTTYCYLLILLTHTTSYYVLPLLLLLISST